VAAVIKVSPRGWRSTWLVDGGGGEDARKRRAINANDAFFFGLDYLLCLSRNASRSGGGSGVGGAGSKKKKNKKTKEQKLLAESAKGAREERQLATTLLFFGDRAGGVRGHGGGERATRNRRGTRRASRNVRTGFTDTHESGMSSSLRTRVSSA
jgi:hypothetical protein